MSKRQSGVLNVGLGRTAQSEPKPEEAKRKQPYKRSVIPSEEQIALWDRAMAYLKEQGIETNFNQFGSWAIDYVAERVLSGEIVPPIAVERKLGK
jgi:hypothetical protein